MSETEIEWTDATWNPIAGCSIMSAGCTNCYAMEMAKRLEMMGVDKYKGLTRRTGKRTVWNGVVKEDRPSLDIPKKWKKSRKIFVNSMSDLFHPAVTPAFIAEVWQVMAETSQHQYQILTKRPDRMAVMLRDICPEPLSNVWLGTSVEGREVIHRIDDLRQVPAHIRFVSFEPLIEAVGQIDLSDIDWAIVGGESGRNARPFKEAWIDEIHNLCLTYGTAFFFKQWGAWGADNKKRSKKRNGRIYKGRVWDAMPAEASADRVF